MRAIGRSKLPTGTNVSVPSVTIAYVKISERAEPQKARSMEQINIHLIHGNAEVIDKLLCKLIHCSMET